MTLLLEAWNLGDPQALERLMPLVVDDLRSIAGALFQREYRANTLQPTALVNELFLRFVERRSVHWKNRKHFFRGAAQIMRRLLVDSARHRQAAKRGGDSVKTTLTDDMPYPLRGNLEDLLALDEALKRLRVMARRQSDVVELKCFGGLTIGEIAVAMEITPSTVKKDWRIARAWLLRELRTVETIALGTS